MKERRAVTSLEVAVESIEDLVNAVVSARLLPDDANRRETQRANDAVQSARDVLHDALSHLTAPRLRVIEGGTQPYPDGKRDEDKPTCLRCKKQVPCKPVCSYWAAAVRTVVARATKDGTES